MVPQAGAPPGENLGPPAADRLVGPAPEPGIALDRLLDLAWLTPAQSVLVGALALEEAARGARRPDPSSLRVTGSGGVLLAGAETDVPLDVSIDGSHQLLDLLRRRAHRHAQHPSADDEQLLRGLESMTGDAESCARALRSLLVAHGCDADRLARQVGELTRQARLGGLHGPGDVAGAGVPIRVPDPRSRRHHSRMVVAVFSACAVLLLTAGYFTLNGQASSLFHRILGTGDNPASITGPGHNQHATRHRQPTRLHQQRVATPGQHHRFGPPSSGPVHQVSLQATGCTAGAACAVKVTVSTSPATTGEAVRWRVGVVDRCDRRTTWSAPASVTAQTGWTSVFATSTVTLPQAHRAALVARTSAPARASSQVVPLPGGHC